MAQDSRKQVSVATVGIDLGDRRSCCCGVGPSGSVVFEQTIDSTRKGVRELFEALEPCRVILEAGGHSRWMSDLLEQLGHDAVVADPRRLAWIFKDPRKNDRRDAKKLALLGLSRSDLKLLKRIQHRSEECQADLAVGRARGLVVRTRAQLINHVRQTVKAFGERLPSSSADRFAKIATEIPEPLQPALLPLIESIAQLTQQIRAYDRKIEELSRGRYPETEILRQIPGVGPLTALAYILTLEDPRRYRTSRSTGAYLGLVPRQDQSGQVDKQLGITKAGNKELRCLLVNAAHYILGWRGPDCQLRRYGERISARGGPSAKKKAVVAVARKLSVLLHHLWSTGEVYDPEHPGTRRPGKKKAG